MHPRSFPSPLASEKAAAHNGRQQPSGLGITDDSGRTDSQYGLPRYPGEEKGKLNITERIENRLWQYSIHGNVFKRWLLETISWAISAICMIGIVVTLLCLKDRPLHKWPLASSGISLNTFVATLSRISSAALLLPVSEALGQLKWSWFFEGQSKKMWDFEIFDNASRGPWGAFQLLLRTKGRRLAALGAAIVLFALALDPFFQQLLDFPERWTLTKDPCTLPRTTRYEPQIPEIFVGGVSWVTEDANLAWVADKFFWDNGTQQMESANGTRAEFPFSCPTDNCTWPTYETLGVCSACEDVSDLFTWACLETELDWLLNLDGSGPSGTEVEFPVGRACGYFINATSEKPILMSGYSVSPDDDIEEILLTRTLPLTTPQKLPLYGDGSIHFKHYRNPILDAILVGVHDGPNSVYRNETPAAMECILTWCVKTIQSNYGLGRYTENVTRTFINTTDGPFPWTSKPVEMEDFASVEIDYIQDVVLDVTDDIYPLDPGAAPRTNATYGVKANTAFNLNVIFDQAYPSFTTRQNTSSIDLTRYDTMITGPPFTRHLSVNPLTGDISRYMERFATGLTNAVRAHKKSSELINGNAYTQETYVGVRWEWLTLPAALQLFTLVFLLLTIFQNSRNRENVGVWKTSAVATLLYGFPDDMQQKITSQTSGGGTPRSDAKELKVKLVPKMGWRVSGNLFSPRQSTVKQQQAPPGWL